MGPMPDMVQGMKEEKDPVKIEIRDYPNRYDGGSGSYDSLYIETKTKSSRKVQKCCWCGKEIAAKDEKFICRAIMHPYVDSEGTLRKPEVKSTPFLGNICSDECLDTVQSKVGEGRDIRIRDWISDARPVVGNKFETDYLKVLEEHYPDKCDKWRTEKALVMLARRDKQYPVHLKNAYFESKGYTKKDRLKMKSGNWVLPGDEADLELGQVVAWAKIDGNLAKLLQEYAK